MAGARQKQRQRNESWADTVRARIQSGQLVHRMQGIGEGTITGDPKLLAVQVAAARLLLAKVLPDLSSVTMSNEGDKPFRIIIEKLPPQ